MSGETCLGSAAVAGLLLLLFEETAIRSPWLWMHATQIPGQRSLLIHIAVRSLVKVRHDWQGPVPVVLGHLIVLPLRLRIILSPANVGLGARSMLDSPHLGLRLRVVHVNQLRQLLVLRGTVFEGRPAHSPIYIDGHMLPLIFLLA